jgi:hypothetical protein
VAGEGARVLGAQADGSIVLVDLAEPGAVRSLGRQDAQIVGIAVAGERAVTAGTDGTLRLWSLVPGEGELDRIDMGSRGDQVTSVAFLPDGRSLLAGMAHGPVLRFAVEKR